MSLSNNFPIDRPTLNLNFARTKLLDPRITFTRTTTAKYYNGVTTAKAEENLLLRSQEFENNIWALGNVTLSTNAAAAPDGTTTADELTETATTAQHNISQIQPVTTGLPYTFSVFVKNTDVNYVQLMFPSAQFGATAYANFDISTGVTGTVGATATATITAVAGSYYRISITATSTATGSATCYITAITSDTAARFESYLGTGKKFFLWGAQIEQRSSVTAYTPTTDQPITNYIPVLQTAAAGQSRFDHNPVTGESLGLLIEEQRTNLALRSEEFDNGVVWSKTRSSVEANIVVAPSGALTADRLLEDTTASATHVCNTDINVTSGTSYTFSIYAKPDGRTSLRLQLNTAGFADNCFATFNISTGVISTTSGGATATITAVGNGWYRCSVTATADATVSTPIQIFLDNGSGVAYTGNGYSGIYLWGAQLEAGAFPTSYIPTVAATVTRNADAASMTGANFSSWYRADEGTLYGEGIGAFSSGALATINTSTSFSNMIVIGSLNSTNEAFRVFANGAAQTDIGTLLLNTNYKLSLGYARNNVAGSINGAAVLTDTSVIVPSVGMDTLQIGRQWNSNMQLGGTIKKLAYYPTRCTNAQLQALTTV